MSRRRRALLVFSGVLVTMLAPRIAHATEDEIADAMLADLQHEAERIRVGGPYAVIDEEMELLKPGAATSIPFEVAPGRSYAVIVTFEEGCPPVEVTVRNGSGEPVAKGTYRSTVSIAGTPGSGPVFKLELAAEERVAPKECRAGALFLAEADQREPAFVTYDNYDLFGGDMEAIPNADLAVCVAACTSRAACVAYTYNRWNNWCYLKATLSELSLNPRARSGVRATLDVPRKSPAPFLIERHENSAFPYGGEQAFTASTVDLCERRCVDHDSCVAFTFFKKTRLCRLMEHVSEEYAPDPSADSGIKWQRHTDNRLEDGVDTP